jgi:hypothetical protein
MCQLGSLQITKRAVRTRIVRGQARVVNEARLKEEAASRMDKRRKRLELLARILDRKMRDPRLGKRNKMIVKGRNNRLRISSRKPRDRKAVLIRSSKKIATLKENNQKVISMPM